MKRWLCVCVLAVSLMSQGIGFCQQDEGVLETQSKEGVVTQVDSIGSVLEIFDGNSAVSFSVDPAARIQRGIDSIMLDDLESNDSVTVEYYKSSNGVLKAVSITDSNIIASF